MQYQKENQHLLETLDKAKMANDFQYIKIVFHRNNINLIGINVWNTENGANDREKNSRKEKQWEMCFPKMKIETDKEMFSSP